MHKFAGCGGPKFDKHNGPPKKSDAPATTRAPWRKETQPEWIEYGVNKPPAPVFPPAPDPVHVPSSSSDGTADSSYFEQVG